MDGLHIVVSKMRIRKSLSEWQDVCCPELRFIGGMGRMKMGIYEATLWKTSIDTQSFGLFPKATPFWIWPFVVSMLDFWGDTPLENSHFEPPTNGGWLFRIHLSSGTLLEMIRHRNPLCLVSELNRMIPRLLDFHTSCRWCKKLSIKNHKYVEYWQLKSYEISWIIFTRDFCIATIDMNNLILVNYWTTSQRTTKE